jgi:hypothetical protein
VLLLCRDLLRMLRMLRMLCRLRIVVRCMSLWGIGCSHLVLRLELVPGVIIAFGCSGPRVDR